MVVGGAGLSGVQVAGELAEMREDSDIEVLLLEQEDAVAPAFPASFQSAVHDALVDAGVTVRTGTGVAEADADVITLTDGSDLTMDQFVWTGGIEGSPALDADRPVVRADLRLGESTFAVGDAARVVDSDGEAVPASAAAAIREARVAADNIGTLVERYRVLRRVPPRPTLIASKSPAGLSRSATARSRRSARASSAGRPRRP